MHPDFVYILTKVNGIAWVERTMFFSPRISEITRDRFLSTVYECHKEVSTESSRGIEINQYTTQ